MGGGSRSSLHYTGAGTTAGISYRPFCRFEGNLETKDGGFASARWVPQDWRWLQEKLEGASGLLLKATGDGRVGYKLNLWTDFSLSNPFSQISYQQGFEPNVGAADDRWPKDEVILPFNEFVPRKIMRDATDAPPLRGAEVRQLGLMLSRFPPFAAGLPNTTGELVEDGKFWLRIEKLYAYHCTADQGYARGNATGAEDWWEEWSKNVQSWWLTQTMGTQVGAQECFAAFGLSLAAELARKFERFKCAVDKSQCGSAGNDGGAAKPGATPGAGCEWVKDFKQKFPDFPDFPDFPFKFELPPVPALPGRLLPQTLLEAAHRPLDPPAAAAAEKGGLDLSELTAAGLGFGGGMLVVGAVGALSLRRKGRLDLQIEEARRMEAAEAQGAVPASVAGLPALSLSSSRQMSA